MGLNLLINMQFRCVQILKGARRDAPSRITAPPGGIAPIGKDSPQYVFSLSAHWAPPTNSSHDWIREGQRQGNGSRQSRMFEKPERSPTIWSRRRTPLLNLRYRLLTIS